MLSERIPPNVTRTLWDSHILWDSHLRWDGEIIAASTLAGRTGVSNTLTGRTIPTNTLTTRPSITGFISYTWDNAPDTWAGVTANWDNYGTISTGTSYTT